MGDDETEVSPIEGKDLVGWGLMPGGSDIRLELSTAEGTTHSVVLPFTALSSLLMTLPRMLQASLDAHCSDGSLRVVQPLHKWRIERSEAGGLILKLATGDGFEVAFALNGKTAGTLGVALLKLSPAGTPTESRPPLN